MKDYVVIGELARLMSDQRQALLFSRSARDILRLYQNNPQLLQELGRERPALQAVSAGQDALEQALDEERRALVKQDEARLLRYSEASRKWYALWPEIESRSSSLPLLAAHDIIMRCASGILPFEPAK